MPILPFIALIALVAGLNVSGQTLMKMGVATSYVNLYIVLGLGLYMISTVFYLKLLSITNLSIVFPVVIGLTVVATFLSGVYFFREETTWIHWIGLSMILLGISLIVSRQG